MLNFILETYHRLIDELDIKNRRYLYASFHIKNRLTGLIGPRGVGKTTLMLQYIKENLFHDKKTFYFSADLVYFQKTTLLEFISNLYNDEGYRIFFIDEIHKYQNWNQEIKNLYDSFPSIKIVFSGSSMLDLIAGSYDLSRRAHLYHLKGMSFREYLNFVDDVSLKPISFEKLLAKPKIEMGERATQHFRSYLKQGYYPFVFEDPHAYYERILRIIDKAIYEDIANYYNLKTPHLHYFKQILRYLASIPPGKLSANKLAQNLSIDHKTAFHYLSILNDVGLTRFVYPYAKGNVMLRKPQKLFLHNSTLLHAMNQYSGENVSKGTERELFFIQSLEDAGVELFYSNQGDFRTKGCIFEIGGKNKSGKQIQDAGLPSYLVKDDIQIPVGNQIPLRYFGFLY